MRRFLGEAEVAPPADQAASTSLFDQARDEGNGASEEPGYYVFKHSLAANKNEPDLQQYIDGDSDFMLLSIHGKSTGSFNINIRDHAGKPIYSSAADASNVIGTAQLPVRIRPALRFPAAGKIGFSLEDTSGAPNDVELVCTGIRRFRTR